MAIEEMGLPSFEASDMEKVRKMEDLKIDTELSRFCSIIDFVLTYVFFQGGKSVRIVNCILALKSYSEWKLKGENGPWRYGVNMKNNFGLRKPFLRKNSEPFVNSISRDPFRDITSTAQPLCSDGNVSEFLFLHSGNVCFYWHGLWSLMEVSIFFTLQGDSRSINALVRSFISERKHEDIPNVRFWLYNFLQFSFLALICISFLGDII